MAASAPRRSAGGAAVPPVTRAWCPVARRSKPSRSARRSRRSNFMERLHSMQGFGVLPRGVVADVGRHDVAVELLGQVEDVVGDAELLGHPAGVVDVGHRAAARVRRAAPQLEGGAHHVMALLDQERGRDRGVDASRHGHQHPHATSVPPAVSAPAQRVHHARHDGQGAVDVGIGGVVPQREADAHRRPARAQRPWRRARGWARAHRSHRTSRRRRTRPPGRAPPAAPPARPRARTGGGARAGRRCRRAPCGVRRAPTPAARRPAGPAARPPGRPPPPRSRRHESQRGGEPDRAGHVLGAAAPLALLAAAVLAGRQGHPRAAPPARRRRPGRPTLWALSDTRSAPRGRLGEVEIGRRLDGVGEDERLRGAAPHRVDDVGQRLDHAGLVVGRHHGHQRACATTARVGQCVEVEHAGTRRRAARACRRPARCRGPADSSTAGCSTAEHSSTASPRSHRARLGGPQHGQVGRLGAARGEDDLAGSRPRKAATSSRASSSRRRARWAGGWLPVGFPSGVGVHLGHGGGHLGPQRRGGGVVEVGRHDRPARRPISRSTPSWRWRTP